MPDYSAGTASVTIEPDFSGFVRALRTKLERVDANLDIEINPDITGFTDRLKTELQRVHATLDIEINPDITGFTTRLETELRRVHATLDIEINPDITGFTTRLETELRRVHVSVDATIRPDLNRSQYDLVNIELNRLARLRFASIVPILDANAAAALDAELDRIARNRTANIDVNRGNISGVGSAADSATRSLTAMSAVRFTALAAGITALVPILLGAVGAAGGLLAMLGALGGVGAIGGSGIIGAFSAMKDATEGASSAAETHAKDLDQVANAQQRVIDAQHNEKDSLQNVEDAQKSLTQARVDAKDAMDNLNLSVKNGALSERGAELAYRRAVVNLQKVQNEARQGKATGLDVETAQLGVDEAAQNITNVRVRNEQTKAKADDANAKGVEGSDQVISAQQRLEQAQYAAQQAQVQTAQAIRDLARAQQEAAKSANEAAGGTDKLAQAMAKLAPSAQDFVRQMQALGPQWTDLRKAVQENLFAGLGDSVTQFANNQLPALKDGLSQLATGLNTAFKSTLTSLDGLFTQLVNNGTMQQFITGVNQALQGMAPVITGLAEAFINFGATVGPSLLPFFSALGTAIGQMSGPLGRIGAVFADALTALLPTFTQLVNALSDGLAPVLPVVGTLLSAVGRALIPLIPSLSQITQVVGNALVTALDALAPYLPQITQAFADILTAVAPLIGPLAQLFGIFAGAIAQNLSSLATALAPVITAFAQGLQPVIPIIADAFAKLTPVFQQVAQTLGQPLTQAVQELMPLLPPLIQAWADMLVALAPLLPQLVDMAVQILPVLVDVLKLVIPLATSMLQGWTEFANFLVPILVPALKKWEDTMTSVWDKISGVFNGMKTALSELKDKFLEVVNKIKEAWQGLVELFKTGGIGGVAGKVIDKALDLIPGHADGGLITGPGTETSDSIIARLSNREYVVKARSAQKHMPLLEAINNDQLPGFAEGGLVSTGSPVVDSMARVVAAKFPGMQLTSGLRNTNDYHGQGKAADFSNGSDDTPEMQRLASFIASSYPQSLELIHAPFSHNIKNGKDVGDGLSVYGDKTMAEHRNHVHWAIASAVSAPAAPSSSVTPASPQAAADPSNYSGDTYIGPSSVDTSKDLQEANKDSGLPQEYSLQGIFSKAGSILATGLLSAFGLENSVLSSSNVYNKALNTTVDFYTKKNQNGTDATTSTPTAATPQATTETPTTDTTPAKHVYDPKGGAEQWRSTVVGVLTGTGRDAGLADRVLAQIRIESNGDPNAVNNYDINAQNGTPSIGLLQVIKPTFDANADGRYPGTQRDPEPNIAAALNYADKRYGGAAKIWPTTAGYALGGLVTGPGTGTSDSILARLSTGEFVVNAAATAANAEWLHAVNAGATFRAPALPAGFRVRGGDNSTVNHRDHSVNFHGDNYMLNTSDLVEEVDRQQSKQAIGLSAALP